MHVHVIVCTALLREHIQNLGQVTQALQINTQKYVNGFIKQKYVKIHVCCYAHILTQEHMSAFRYRAAQQELSARVPAFSC
jgi:hypothetical protein